MKTVLVIGFGGFLGAVARYFGTAAVERWVAATSFPWGTLGVNLLGCYLTGVLFGFVEFVRPLPESWRLALGPGFLGGFTTFSAYGLQSLGLFQQGRIGVGVAYAGGSVVAGLLAVWAGMLTVNCFRG